MDFTRTHGTVGTHRISAFIYGPGRRPPRTRGSGGILTWPLPELGSTVPRKSRTPQGWWRRGPNNVELSTCSANPITQHSSQEPPAPVRRNPNFDSGFVPPTHSTAGLSHIKKHLTAFRKIRLSWDVFNPRDTTLLLEYRDCIPLIHSSLRTKAIQRIQRDWSLSHFVSISITSFRPEHASCHRVCEQARAGTVDPSANAYGSRRTGGDLQLASARYPTPFQSFP